MQGWQEVYEWASSQPDDTEMDGEWWWDACIKNILVQAFGGTKEIISKGEIKSPSHENQWKGNLLTELYDVLYDEHKLTVGQFKSVLEKVKPVAEKEQ